MNDEFSIANKKLHFGRIIVLSLVASFGTASIAANAVSGTIVMFQVLPGIYFNMGMFGTWVAMFIDWIVKAIIFVWRYISGRWMRFHAI